MNAYKIASAVLIVVFLLFITAYVVVITRNITVSSSIWLFNWNPPPARNAIPLALTYPEALIPSFPNGTMFMASMLLTFDGQLAENTLLQVENASCQIPPPGNVKVLIIGFQNAFLPNATSNIQQGHTWGNGAVFVAFSRTQQSPPESWSNLTVEWENKIIFPVAGDYSPSIFMTVDNGPSPVQYTYDQIKIHVLSASEVNAENTNRLNLGLTFAILAFSFIEGFMVIHQLLKKEEKKTKPEQTPNTTTPTSVCALLNLLLLRAYQRMHQRVNLHLLRPYQRINQRVTSQLAFQMKTRTERKKRNGENKTKNKPTQAADKP